MAEPQKWEFEAAGNKLTLSFDTVRKYLTQGNGKTTDQEITYFIAHCVHQKINPFIKEAYLIKYSDNDPAAIVTAYHVLMARAQEDSGYNGYESGVIVQGTGGEVSFIEGTVYNEDKAKLIGGWCKVYNTHRDHPAVKNVKLRTYIKKTRDGKVTRFWSEENQADQIEKVAIAQAHRRACPRQLQGMYLAEEVASEPLALPLNVEEATKKTIDGLKDKAVEAKGKGKQPPVEPAPFDRDAWYERTGGLLREYGVAPSHWLIYINSVYGIDDRALLTPEQCQQLETVLIEDPATVVDAIAKLRGKGEPQEVPLLQPEG